MNINEILEKVFPKEIDELISKQDYLGMRLSGGIDSALMTFLTMTKYPNKKIIPITIYNKLRPAARNPVRRVIEALKILNPNSILLEPVTGEFDTSGYEFKPEMEEEFIKSGYTKKFHPKDVFQRKWFKDIFDRKDNVGKVNILFSGETLNPPMDIQKKLKPQSTFPKDRNLKRENVLSKYKYNGIYKYEYRPFRNLTKKEVASWVKDLNLDTKILPLTETCELEIYLYPSFDNDYKLGYTKWGEEPCMRCWPCREKYWAYGYYDFMTEEKDDRYKII